MKTPLTKEQILEALDAQIAHSIVLCHTALSEKPFRDVNDVFTINELLYACELMSAAHRKATKQRLCMSLCFNNIGIPVCPSDPVFVPASTRSQRVQIEDIEIVSKPICYAIILKPAAN